MRRYPKLTQEERYQIQALVKTGRRYPEIASIIGEQIYVNSRKVRRNRGLRGYRLQQAHRLALSPRHAKTRPPITAETWQLVERLESEQGSRGQVNGWLRQTQTAP